MKIEDIVFTQVGGLRTACVTREQLVRLVTEKSNRARFDRVDKQPIQPILIFSTNGHSISIANSDKEMGAMLNQADILHADGQSVVTFSKYFSEHRIPERSATTDMIHDIPQLTRSPLRHYLLGGKQQTVENCATILQSRYANFDIAGMHHGYFNEQDEAQLVENINASQPDVLWVGLGKPKEQLFALRQKYHLQVPVIITCGGCFNYVTGDYKRAPKIFQKTGFEWLHRALTEPRKLLWRYVTTNPHAIFCVLKHRYHPRTL